MKKKIAIIGAGNIGKTIAGNLTGEGRTLKESDLLMITRLPELPEMWVDPNEPVFNHRKHQQTCAKNRKKRKKRKRR